MPLQYYRIKVMPRIINNYAEEYWSKKLEEATSKTPNNLKLIKEALYYVPDLVRKPCGKQALRSAVVLARYSSVKLLFERGASLNAQGNNGDAPLHITANGSMAQLLVNRGADINQKNDAGETPFFTAIKNSRLEVAHVYFKAGANVNENDNNKDTPLHYAVNNLGSEEVKFLLYHGADANQPNKQWLTAYDIVQEWNINDQAERKRKEDIVGAFQVFKAVFDEIAYPSVDDTHFTVMSLLASKGQKLKEILMLDAAGYCSRDIIFAEKVLNTCDGTIWLELTSKLSSYSKEVLQLARLIGQRSFFRQQLLQFLQNNNFFVAKGLVQANPYILYTYQGEHEFDEVSVLFADKFLDISADSPNYRRVKELLLEGFNLDACDDEGKSLLCHLIMDKNDTKKYKDLLKAGVKVNTVDSSGKTPLSYAVALGDEDKVRALLEYGAVVRDNMIQEQEEQSSMQQLLREVFNMQGCSLCGRHSEDMSVMPCINRHVYFICPDCYGERDNCYLCKRPLDDYGL